MPRPPSQSQRQPSPSGQRPPAQPQPGNIPADPYVAMSQQIATTTTALAEMRNRLENHQPPYALLTPELHAINLQAAQERLHNLNQRIFAAWRKVQDSDKTGDIPARTAAAREGVRLQEQWQACQTEVAALKADLQTSLTYIRQPLSNASYQSGFPSNSPSTSQYHSTGGRPNQLQPPASTQQTPLTAATPFYTPGQPQNQQSQPRHRQSQQHQHVQRRDRSSRYRTLLPRTESAPDRNAE